LGRDAGSSATHLAAKDHLIAVGRRRAKGDRESTAQEFVHMARAAIKREFMWLVENYRNQFAAIANLIERNKSNARKG
jgi:hypothetical protein